MPSHVNQIHQILHYMHELLLICDVHKIYSYFILYMTVYTDSRFEIKLNVKTDDNDVSTKSCRCHFIDLSKSDH